MYTKQLQHNESFPDFMRSSPQLAEFKQLRTKMWLPKTIHEFAPEAVASLQTNLKTSKLGQSIHNIELINNELDLRDLLRLAAADVGATGKYSERSLRTDKVKAILRYLDIEQYYPLLFTTTAVQGADSERCQLRQTYKAVAQKDLSAYIDKLVIKYYALPKQPGFSTPQQRQKEKIAITKLIGLLQQTDYELRYRRLKSMKDKLQNEAVHYLHSQLKVPKFIQGVPVEKVMLSFLSNVLHRPAAALQFKPSGRTFTVTVPVTQFASAEQQIPPQLFKAVEYQLLKALAFSMGNPQAMREEGCNAFELVRSHEHDRLKAFLQEPVTAERLMDSNYYAEMYSLYMRYYGIFDGQGRYWVDIGKTLNFSKMPTPSSMQNITDTELLNILKSLYYAAEHFSSYQLYAYWRGSTLADKHPEIKDPYLNGIALYKVHSAGSKGTAN